MNLLSHCLLLTSTSLQPTEMIILNGIIKGLYLGTKSSFFGVSTLHGVSSAIIVDDHESEESDMVVCALDLTSSNNLGQVRNDFSVVGSLVLVTTLLVVHQVVCLRLLCWVWSCSVVKWLSNTFWIKMKHKLKWERERDGSDGAQTKNLKNRVVCWSIKWTITMMVIKNFEQASEFLVICYVKS